MKKFLLALVAFFMGSSMLFAQNDVTQFMGIPVDGTKSEMIQKLREKGFSYSSYTDALEGQFNGRTVSLYVSVNNGKVCRIIVVYLENSSEITTISAYNTLLSQFKNNSKYLHVSGDEIPDSENLSYETTIHNKRYDAIFAQLGSDMNVSKRPVWFCVMEKYGKFTIPIYYENGYNMAQGEDL